MNDTPYCHPAGFAPGCPICARCATDPAYRAFILSVPHVKIAAAPRRWKLQCISLGPKLPGQPCGSDLHTCLRFGDVTAKVRPCKEAARDCQSCPEYERAVALSIPPAPSDVLGRKTQESL